MASSEENKPIVGRISTTISTDNLDALLQLFSPDYVDHSAPPGLDPRIEGTKFMLGTTLK